MTSPSWLRSWSALAAGLAALAVIGAVGGVVAGRAQPKHGSGTATRDTSCGAFRDDFSSPALDPQWGSDYGQFVDQLAVRAGWLTLSAKDGADLFPGNAQPPMLTRPMTGSYTIQTTVRANPRFWYQGAGLVLFAGTDTYVRLETGAGEKGSAIAFEYNLGGTDHHKIVDPWKDTVPTGPTVELRLTRQGDEAKAAWRNAGSRQWQELGAAKVKADVVYHAGILTLNRSQPMRPDPQKLPFAAGFDYVETRCA
jgi:beta-xylosidase